VCTQLLTDIALYGCGIIVVGRAVSTMTQSGPKTPQICVEAASELGFTSRLRRIEIDRASIYCLVSLVLVSRGSGIPLFYRPFVYLIPLGMTLQFAQSIQRARRRDVVFRAWTLSSLRPLLRFVISPFVYYATRVFCFLFFVACIFLLLASHVSYSASKHHHLLCSRNSSSEALFSSLLLLSSLDSGDRTRADSNSPPSTFDFNLSLVPS